MLRLLGNLSLPSVEFQYIVFQFLSALFHFLLLVGMAFLQIVELVVQLEETQITTM